MSPANHIDVEQGSQMWAELRCGLVTASRASDVIATKKQTKKQLELGIREEMADRRIYRSELICEILTRVPYAHYVSQEMQWGLDQEQFARAAYELAHDVLVETVGFILHPTVPRFGASPDGLVGDDGMIQIKCPTTMTHLSWLAQGTIPVEHVAQMLAELSCSGRKWIDFVSYDPRLPEHLQLFVRRYHRDEKLIAVLEAEVVHFNSEIDDTIAALPQKPQGIVESLDQVNDDEAEF